MADRGAGTETNILRPWLATDALLLWPWALGVAASVSGYEEFLGGESGHPAKFWADRVPGYFAATLVFTAVVLGLANVAGKAWPALKGWRGVFAISIALALAYPLLMPSPIDLRDAVRTGPVLALASIGYLLPPALIAAFLRRRRQAVAAA